MFLLSFLLLLLSNYVSILKVSVKIEHNMSRLVTISLNKSTDYKNKTTMNVK